MKTKKNLILLFLIISCVFSFTACRSMGYKDEAESSGAPMKNAEIKPAPADDSISGGTYINDYNDYYQEYEGYDNIETLAALLPQESAAPIDTTRKIIRDAYMDIEAKNASELYKNLVAYNNSLGGYEFSSDVKNFENYSIVEAVLKVPPYLLDTFMNYAGENGKVINSKVNSNDVTDNYYDMKTRVETKRRSLESYYKMLENANTLNDIVSLQRTIDGIIEEIEAFEGKIRVIDSLTDMATVRLLIKQENDPEPLEEEPRKEIEWDALDGDDMWYFMKGGFITVVNFFFSILQWFVIALTVSLPVLVPVVIITFILLKKRKKNKIKQKELIKKDEDIINPNNIN